MFIVLVLSCFAREVQIENMGIVSSYTAIPERVVVLSYPQAELMTELGIEDRIVALAYANNRIEDVMPQYRDAVSKISVFENIPGGVPSLEQVLQENPDFVYGTVYSFYPRNVGAAEDFIKNDINIYASQGTCVTPSSLEDTYADIRNIGKIFAIEDKAEKLIQTLRTKQTAITEKISEAPASTVFIYDSGKKTFYTAGNSIESDIIRLAGGNNIYDDINQQFCEVSVESVIEKNPDVIIVHQWDATDDAKQKIEYLKSVKELSDITAVKENAFIILPLKAVFPGIQNIKALEYIAKNLHPELF